MDVRELYQQLIIDHGRHPRNFGVLESATHQKEGFNPLCGDRLTLYVEVQSGVIARAMFAGEGCAISMASASLMTEAIQGKTVADADALFAAFHALVTVGTEASPDEALLGKLWVLGGVAAYPARVKCATLAWHTLVAGLHGNTQQVSTE